MIGNVGLPGWFVATRLRVMLKQPNLRGIPGSFGAIFSDVNRLDVCPVGYYNRRMTFLRGTGGAACYNRDTVSLDRFQAQPIWEMSV